MTQTFVFMTAALLITVLVLAASAPAADEPVNRWVMRNPDGPNIIWENDIAYDPATHLIVWYGGHAWGYPQSNYTFLYDLTTNKWRESAAPYRPLRRCLVMLNYLDSCGKMACTQGSSGHGSMPEGGFAGEYKRVNKSDPRGPWLYDVTTDRWENCRTLPPIWKREAHAQCAYDPTTDSLVWLTGDKLGLYCPRTNRVSYRTLPKELSIRLGYGIAADPVAGKIVLFGGSGPGGWVWEKDLAAGYEKGVHNDTWIYDVATNKWKQCQPKTAPPKGMPVFDHRFIPMVYHDASGTIIMQQTPLDKFDPDTTKWPPTQFWSFDVAKEEWTLLKMENTPPFQGLLTYAKAEDLLVLVGGGKDGGLQAGDGGGQYYRPSLSKQLWTCRAAVPADMKAVSAPPPRLAKSDQPWRPSGLVASVESDKKVVLRWNANAEKDLAGYKVYRATGAEVEKGEGKLLTDKPVAETTFTDAAVDLADGVARSYWVTAVSKGGVESGAAPLAYTFPDPPTALTAKVTDGGKAVTVKWDWPKDVKVAGFNVYHVNNHLNTHGLPADKVTAWYNSWKPITDRPIDGREAVFQIPPGDKAKHHYFYVRAVNVLGQEGFYTDIASATDKRFHP